MKCGFCGRKLSEDFESQNFENGRLQISQFFYGNCVHINTNNFSSGFDLRDSLEFVRNLIESQLFSIERLEKFLLEKKEQLLSQLKDFCRIAEVQLLECQKASINFPQNFSRLANIEIDSCVKNSLKSDLRDYFNAQELRDWALFCGKEASCLLGKLKQLDCHLSQQLEESISARRSTAGQQLSTFRAQFNLQESAYKMLDTDLILKAGKTPDKTSAEILPDIGKNVFSVFIESYSDLHGKLRNLAESFLKDIFLAIKIANTSFARNKYLILNSIGGIKENCKVIIAFESFEEVFSKSVEEKKQRAKFGFIVNKLLTIVNELVRVENKRRTEFLKKYASRIPSQIFKNFGNLALEISQKRIEDYFESDVRIEKNLEDFFEKTLQNIKLQVLEL